MNPIERYHPSGTEQAHLGRNATQADDRIGKSILVTGMSGTGKTSALVELNKLGFRTLDTDYDHWSYTVRSPNNEIIVCWDLLRIKALLAEHGREPIFVSGCATNQNEVYHLFDHIVVLTAPWTTLLERLKRRSAGQYGTSEEDQTEILGFIDTVEPSLVDAADVVIDTTQSLSSVVLRLATLALAEC